MKIAVIHNIITPYRVDLFNTIAKFCTNHNIKFRVFYETLKEKRRAWNVKDFKLKHEYEILDSIILRLKGKEIYINTNLIDRLRKYDPDVLVVGGFSFSALQSYIYCYFFKKKMIIWSDSIGMGKLWLRSLWRRFLVKRAHSFIASGTLAKEYLLSLGAAPKKVYISWLTFDVKTFSQKVSKFREVKEKIKKKLGINEKLIILFSGRLVKHKGIYLLIDIFKKLQEVNNDVGLLILGDGPERDSLKAYSKNLKVYLVGFIQPKDLPRYFAIADLFLFPTLKDQWGIVINEAISAGLPVIVSKFAGAAHDLVINEFNGYIVDPFDVEKVAVLINDLLKNAELMIRMGQNSSLVSRNFAIEKAANDFLKAAKSILSQL